MTTAVINKSGVDQVVIEFIQQASDETEVNLRNVLLSGDLSYHFTVSELSVPLDKCPMHPITQEFELFRVIRRNVGVSLTAEFGAYNQLVLEQGTFNANVSTYTDIQIQAVEQALGLNLGAFDRAAYIAAIVAYYTATVLASKQTTTNLPLIDEADTRYILSPNNPFFSPAEFVKDLQRFANVFNVEVSKQGIESNYYSHNDDDDQKALDDDALDAGQIAPHSFLNFNITCDGSLEISGDNVFWNCFAFQMTKYGASLLGIDSSRFITVNDVHYLAFTGDSSTTAFSDPDNFDNFVAPVNDADHIIDIATPIYQSSDQRVKVSVSSHLPIASNTRIDNEIETVDRDICEKFFENKIRAEIRYDANNNFQGVSIRSDVYSGQRSFIKKSDPHTSWMKLLTSYQLTFYRFQLKITYRVFNETTGKYSLSRQKLPVPENRYWLMTLVFVSDV